MALKLPSLLCLLLMPELAMAQGQLDNDATAELQKHFAEAYNRGDLDAMAAAFTANAVRVTPSGMFQGREAIGQSFQDALKMGLHDYTVQRLISRPEGNFVFNAGEWQAKIGNKSFHGYYTAIIVYEGDQPKIMEETVNIAYP